MILAAPNYSVTLNIVPTTPSSFAYRFTKTHHAICIELGSLPSRLCRSPWHCSRLIYVADFVCQVPFLDRPTTLRLSAMPHFPALLLSLSSSSSSLAPRDPIIKPFIFVRGPPRVPTVEPDRSLICFQVEKPRSHVGKARSQKLVEVHKYHVPLLSTNEVISRFQTNVLGSTHHQAYRAMYSSIIGGITTDPAMMLLPLDDHMVHRGHGVFDTAVISNGYLYELDAHLDRLLKSASMAKITPPFNRSTLREILVETAAASDCREGLMRYWLSAGPGGFSLSSRECKCASFYAMVHTHEDEACEEGVAVVTSSIPIKPPQFAIMKSVNYLPNALTMLEAEEKGTFAGIWIDREGFVAEGQNVNVAFINQAGELLMPAFDKILSGCTAKRTLALAHELLAKSSAEVKQQVGQLKGIEVRLISLQEAKNASEMMLIGSSLPVVPVVKWDQQHIGNGKPGPITIILRDLLRQDMLSGPLTHLEPIPYKDGLPNAL